MAAAEAQRRVVPAWTYKPGPDVAPDPPPGLVKAQKIARAAAAAGLAAVRPGVSEKEVDLAVSAYLLEQGVERVWTITNVGLGENTRICFPTNPPTDLAAAELEATGETVARRGGDERDALTPRELQIALLLAEGRTTRETAAALFLSPKTVEYHLRHVYTKLDIASRAELATRLAGAS